MHLPRWLAILPVSLAVHAGIVGAAVVFLRAQAMPPALIIDLNAILAGHDDGPGPGAGPPPGAGASAPRAAPRAMAPVPAPLPPPSPRVEAAPPRPADPSPAVSPESVPSDSHTAPTSASAPIRGAEDGVTRVAGQGSVDGASSASGSVSAGAGVGTGSGAGGDQLASVAPGTGGGIGAGLGSEYAAYLARLRQRIHESLRYPPAARRQGVTGTVHLEIAIAADGAIADVSVITSSSHDVLDRAAVDAARSLPRQPFPADVRPRPLKVRLPVVFELQ